MITHAELVIRLLDYLGSFTNIRAYTDTDIAVVPVSLLLVGVDHVDLPPLQELGDVSVFAELPIIRGHLEGRAFHLGIVELADGKMSLDRALPLAIADCMSIRPTVNHAHVNGRVNGMRPGI
jgi:hypothetical protein